jgi:hypothetical protein
MASPNHFREVSVRNRSRVFEGSEGARYRHALVRTKPLELRNYSGKYKWGMSCPATATKAYCRSASRYTRRRNKPTRQATPTLVRYPCRQPSHPVILFRRHLRLMTASRSLAGLEPRLGLGLAKPEWKLLPQSSARPLRRAHASHYWW